MLVYVLFIEVSSCKASENSGSSYSRLATLYHNSIFVDIARNLGQDGGMHVAIIKIIKMAICSRN